MGSLSLSKVGKSFGSTEVLDDINLTVSDGEFVVFVGPSGCGKSTLLRIIAGLETASHGDINIDEALVNHLSPTKRGIAMVFQTYGLYPHLTVRGNMSLGLKQAGHPAAEIKLRVDQASTMLELGDYLDRRPAELSGGQRQRVAIGRAVVRDPTLFLFDEPLSNLDAALRVNTRLEIAKLHHKLNATMIYVTHDQVEAMTLADRIVVLNNGRIEQVGTPMELYNQPRNRFVASFIGSPQMNFLPADAAPEFARDAFTAQADVLGIRPEHVTLGAESSDLSGSVSHVEQLGGDTNIYIDTQSAGMLTVRQFGQVSIPVGSTQHVALDRDFVFGFDASGTAMARR